MSDTPRGAFRGSSRGGRGRGAHSAPAHGEETNHRGGHQHHRGGRGGRGRGGHGGAAGEDGEKPKKENILDLSKYMDKEISVEFTGGRKSTLKGYDQLMNLVLDSVREHMYDAENNTTTDRELGLVVARGTLLVVIAPVDGSEEIANPFLAGMAEGEGAEGEQQAMGQEAVM